MQTCRKIKLLQDDAMHATYVPALAQVRYEDGDMESVLMATSRVRLEVFAGETLSPPSASDLALTAQHVFREAKASAGIAVYTHSCTMNLMQGIISQ